MSSLTVNNRIPQLRGIPVPGTPSFRYERRIANRWVECNHSEALAIVGIRRRELEALCARLTAVSVTTGGSPSGSSDGSQRLDALYTCETGTHMNVSARLSSSSVSSQR